MATEIKLPSLGDGIDSADVLELLVSEGETVKKDQGLMEMETDKATVTIPSPSAGKIVKIAVAAGQSVAVGAVIGMIESSEAATVATAPPQTATPAPAPAAPAPAPAAPAPAPAAAAAPPQAANPPAPQQSTAPQQSPAPKPAQSQPAPAAPESPVPQPDQRPPVRPVVQPAAAAPTGENLVASDPESVIPAGPAIRRFAREVGVDLSAVAGSGESGRITRDDVLAVVRQGQRGGAGSRDTGALPPSASTSLSSPTASSTSAPSSDTASSARTGMASTAKTSSVGGVEASDDYGSVHIEKMTKIRKTIANQMHRSWTNVPRVTNFDDADVTDLEIFRQSSKEDYIARGIKLTTMPFLIKAIATALKHHPSLNASIDIENEQIIYKDYVNIGIAVDTERGLVVPTLKNADRMSIPDIAFALSDLSSRVRSNDFGVNDLRGGSFTISNLGAIGGTYSTPIVNVPEVAILLVGRTRKLPVVMDDDSIKPRSMMPLSLAYDHRLVDGGTAARFLNDVISFLEAPSRLLLAI